MKPQSKYVAPIVEIEISVSSMPLKLPTEIEIS